IAMFEAGEIPIFTRSGMPGVFFGGAIAGWDLPNLTYMICHPSMEQSKDDWAKFGADEDWKKLRSQPQYKDNVSKIVNRFLRPMPGSQI
ncbi:MAG TPA: NIPSNAP family protein, partial [Tepidisphaeraceae bacterium]|nr:NIPSNAP family protein [Tepidisphaeraceae bacterium]